ncbi:Serine/threonine-protein kinase-like protein [Drosera capensis]
MEFQLAGLGSMSSIAISYGERGPVFCGLKSDGSHLVTCYGQNPAILYETPAHFPFLGLTGGNSFVCGLLIESSLPYCWGSSAFISMGVPQPMTEGAQYLEISAGDNHLCALRKPLMGRLRNTSLVDCWGYNMTAKHVFDGQIKSISAGSEFNCGLFAENRTTFCWGDETSSNVISLIPTDLRFQLIGAGGYHACGIVEGVDAKVFCWGSLNTEEELTSGYTGNGNVDSPPGDPMLTVVGGKFHACGIKSYDRGLTCWGVWMEQSTPPPVGRKFYGIAAGDYFSCGILADKSLQPLCWGLGFPKSLPLAVSPGTCQHAPCQSGFYELSQSCHDPRSHICVPCQNPCSQDETQCVGPDNDGRCVSNCSNCPSTECSSNCSLVFASNVSHGKKISGFWAVQLPMIVAEAVFAAFLVCSATLIAILYVKYRLRNCQCWKMPALDCQKNGLNVTSPKVRPELEELKVRRAQMFTYEELERATGGFKEESVVGKGSFSCVFKGVLKDGTVVAVKRAIMSLDMKKSSKEFRTELDLLSRLNHAHLLNLLGYCEEGGKRLLVYEYMAHGSLHQHLHGKNKVLKEQLDWIKRVTIAVQAARGIEYLHGYACPPVIHRDIKSSNILIDEEHNARVADFGLSLLGPANSSSPLAELPAGTLGYLDPEYYRLHYLTTKSDVYSFGVLLLEILSGRKAIDMQYEDGNIVEWAVPLIKAGDINAILDPVLKPPPEIEALKRIANVACKCVRMRGKDRPTMDKVTTALERALALLMGSPCSEQPILPTEVILGSSRMHKKSSRRSSNRSETDVEDQRFEFRAPSWITFPSVTSSQRRKSSVSDADVEPKNPEGRNGVESGSKVAEGLRSLEEEIGPASPQESLLDEAYALELQPPVEDSLVDIHPPGHYSLSAQPVEAWPELIVIATSSWRYNAMTGVVVPGGCALIRDSFFWSVTNAL